MIVTGCDDFLIEWACKRLGYKAEDFYPATAIGFQVGNKLAAVAIYSNYRTDSIEISFASDDPKWCTRGHLFSLFAYPFIQLGCIRISLITDTQNDRINKLVTGLGFIKEGTLRKGLHGKDAHIWGMLKQECKWIRSKHGKEIAENASSA